MIKVNKATKLTQKQQADVTIAIEDLTDAINSLNERMDDMQADIDKIKSQTCGHQPNKKFKVAKTVEHPNTGEEITKPYNETADAVKDEVRELGSVTTAQMDVILKNNGVDVSRPTVLDIMRRYADNFDYFTVNEPKKGVRKSLHLQDKS